MYEVIGMEHLENEVSLDLKKNIEMRYGENPHQNAAYFVETDNCGVHNFFTEGKLHGKELSYNNIADISGALRILADLDNESCVAVKHSNPCGAATRGSVYESFKATYEGDSMSIFGGIVAMKGIVKEDTAELLSKIFLEIIIAQKFTEGAFDILSKKKNIRLMEYEKWKDSIFNEKACEVKRVLGGYLIQERDTLSPMNEEYKKITEKAATDAELEDLRFAQTIVKNVKSNAIVVVKDKMLLGVGAGQMNRVTSARIALDWAGEKARGAVIGSDAFFPMDDTVRLAAERGITAIAQPGGSVRDEDSITACNELGVAMYFTGNRHFYH